MFSNFVHINHSLYIFNRIVIFSCDVYIQLLTNKIFKLLPINHQNGSQNKCSWLGSHDETEGGKSQELETSQN